ncbi:hypothetical protein AVEN_164129-1 [Araneus ventricosus]|uniref:Uncharacterized protein n=1 Tax=Araneus ventricosus TaxID=182803 RepID=A0A4Y2LYV3_ARAVE|nr:hypothetical protein AVEN_164129-1 [Araneus ventricosus]
MLSFLTGTPAGMCPAQLPAHTYLVSLASTISEAGLRFRRPLDTQSRISAIPILPNLIETEKRNRGLFPFFRSDLLYSPIDLLNTESGHSLRCSLHFVRSHPGRRGLVCVI